MGTKFVEEFKTHLSQVLGRRQRTIDAYVPEVADFLRFVKCREEEIAAVAKALCSVDQQTLQAFLTRPTLSRKSIKVSAVTFNLRLAAVRALYAFLCNIELLQVDVAAKIRRQKSFARETVPLTLSEMIRLVEAVRQHTPERYRDRNVAIVQVLMHCSLRVHEVIGLSLEQVDLENYLLLDVRRKGGKSFASTINDVVAQALRDCIISRSELHPPETEGAVFVSDRGQRFAVRSVQELVKANGKIAGIKQTVTPHLLRHSSATQLAALGTPLRVVQDICGHSSVETTTRYVHTASADIRRATDAMAVAWKEQLGRQVA